MNSVNVIVDSLGIFRLNSVPYTTTGRLYFVRPILGHVTRRRIKHEVLYSRVIDRTSSKKL
jgi:hypothetical protein